MNELNGMCCKTLIQRTDGNEEEAPKKAEREK